MGAARKTIEMCYFSSFHCLFFKVFLNDFFFWSFAPKNRFLFVSWKIIWDCILRGSEMCLPFLFVFFSPSLSSISSWSSSFFYIFRVLFFSSSFEEGF